MTSEALYLFNTFTKKKTIFKPFDETQIYWYHCDQIDEMDFSHIKFIISIDIMRRVMQDFFNLNIHFYSNITDINDKIIKKIQEKYLLDSTNPLDNDVFLKYVYEDYEEQFFNYMKIFNIQHSTVITHVSQYVPKTIDFIEKIFEKGFAYELNSCIYFDTIKFHKQYSNDKTESDCMCDLAVLNEGEEYNTLTSTENTNKKNNCDFVLWKKSKIGEPAWPSPWALGRPGSDIGCAVISTSNKKFDIHSGFMDSKFLCYNYGLNHCEDNKSWFFYLNDCNHLNICDYKPSKILKNVVNIEQLLENYSPIQLRLYCLLNLWSSTFDYSNEKMNEARNYEEMLNEFFFHVKIYFGGSKQSNDLNTNMNHNKDNEILDEFFHTTKKQIQMSLCDSIDTSSVMEHIRHLILKTNSYMNIESSSINHHLIESIVTYIKCLYNTFGLKYSTSYNDDDIDFTPSTTNVEDNISPNKAIIKIDYRPDV